MCLFSIAWTPARNSDTVWIIKEATECGHENVMDGDLEAGGTLGGGGGVELNKILKS